jgi:hypothetical protein
VVEGARLESVYAPKAYPGFESLSLRFLYFKMARLEKDGPFIFMSEILQLSPKNFGR